MVPLRGGAPIGQRLKAKVPYGHWKTMTFIATLRCDGIDAPFVFNQPINGASFTQRVEEQLCPTLAQSDIVILDHLSRHKTPIVRPRPGPEAQGFCSFRPTVLISTRSNRSLPSSSISCERPLNELKKTDGGASAACSITSLPPSAQTTSETLDTRQSNVIRL